MPSTFLSLGFRPFFLVGALYAVLAILYWGAYQLALVGTPPYFDGTQWHAHEMLFGFVAAILAGFLLTASRNWAKTRGVHGHALLFLLLLWIAGRIGILAAAILPGLITAALDLAFLPFLAVMLGKTLAKGGRKNNFVFVALIAVLFAANLLMHLEALGVTADTMRRGYLLGVDTMVMVMVLMGGRVIPMFTQNAVPGIKVEKRAPVESLALAGAALYLAADFIDELSIATAIAAIVAGAANLVRLSFWKSWTTAGLPVLWVLHVGYLFLALGLLLRGLSLSVFPMKSSISIHLLTAGSMGVLIVGMISRVALGHTGRPIIVSRTMVAAYGLVVTGALVRVLAAVLLPEYYLSGMAIASLLWGLGFAVFFRVYWPILTRPRVDGLEG